MDLFGRIRKIDSSLQRGLDNGFARVFGGAVVPAEIDELLKQEVEDTLMENRQGAVLASSNFTVHVSPRDHEALLEKNPDLADELRGRLQRFIRNEGWQNAHPVSVTLVSDDDLHTGQLKSRSTFDPPAAPQEKPAPKEAPAPDNASGFGRSGASDGPAWSAGSASRAAGAAGAAGAAAAGAGTGAGASANPLVGLAQPSPSEQAAQQAQQALQNQQAPSAEGWGAPQPAAEPAKPATAAGAASAAGAAGAAPNSSYPGTEVISHVPSDPVRTGDQANGAAAAGQAAPPQTTVTLLLQDGSARSYVLQVGENVIGRGNAVDFRLPDTGVSRQHAEIAWDGFDAVLTDLKSTNGTTVNEIPVENWLLADGDVVTIGHSEIEVRFT